MMQEDHLGRWLTVICGELTVYISPLEDCQAMFNCTMTKTTLNAGESGTMYFLFYFFILSVNSNIVLANLRLKISEECNAISLS